MELQQYLQILRQYWRSTLATVLLCVALAAGFTLLQSPTYTATSTVFVTVESGGTAGELSQGATYAERTVTSFVKVASTEVVLKPVIEQLGLDTTPAKLAQNLTVTSPASTSLIQVKASSAESADSPELANAVAQSLLTTVGTLSPKAPDGTQLVNASVIDTALPPTSPSDPNPVRNLALGGLLGILLGFGQAVGRSVLDNRVRTTNDVEQVTDLPVLASINTLDTSADKAALDISQWTSGEAYRRLRTNIGFVGLGGERRPSIVITSATPGEGKTETAVNLARVLAQAGENVLLVDADLRKPQVATRMHIDAELGLSDVLTGRGSLEDLLIDVIPDYLAVLPAGTIPPNPSELLGSDAMARLVGLLERRYDYVMFDTPPVLPVTDAAVLGTRTGGAVVVARSGLVRRTQLDQALELLDAGGVTKLGIVLNDVPATGRNQSAYYSQPYGSATSNSSTSKRPAA